MSVGSRAFGLAAVGAIAFGCGGGGTPTPTAPGIAGTGSATTPARSVTEASPLISHRLLESSAPLPPFTYEARGRRDPFARAKASPAEPGVDVGRARLAGVIQGRELLALVEMPDGLAYILKPGDALGRARVIDVDLRSITFTITGLVGEKDNSQALTLAID